MSSEPLTGRSTSKVILNAVHNKVIFSRRVRVLSSILARTIPDGGRVLDLGSGDGSVALELMRLRRDLMVEGVDVKLRPDALINVTQISGDTLPFEDQHFDYVTIVDVLHHTTEPAAVLAEARRVARKGVIVKDHLLEGVAARPTLRVMDWVGNRGHDVALPYNYLTREEWNRAFELSALSPVTWIDRLHLYPAPASLLFDRGLHFVALLAPTHA